MLDSHVPRDQKHEQFQEDSRLLLHHFVDCRATAPAKGGVLLPDGVRVEGVTRALGIPAKVSNSDFEPPPPPCAGARRRAAMRCGQGHENGKKHPMQSRLIGGSALRLSRRQVHHFQLYNRLKLRYRVVYLLVRHRLNAAGMLDSHVPRDQKNEQFQKDSRLLLHHFVDCRATAPAKGGVHLPDGVRVEGVTRALGIPAKVSRHPLRELSVWLSLDDLIGHYGTSCFVGPILGGRARDRRCWSSSRPHTSRRLCSIMPCSPKLSVDTVTGRYPVNS